MIKTITKKIWLENGVNISIDLEIPLSCDAITFDDSMIEDVLINQCLRGMREAIITYKQSELPDMFLDGQEIIITNQLPGEIYGAMSMIGDIMLVDADAISDIRPIKASFLFGHEMGHKIEKYRPMRDSKELAARFLGIGLYGHERVISEALADEFGNIAIGESSSANRFNPYFVGEQHKILQHTILRDVYKV